LNQVRLHCLKHNPDDYPNIWEGKCKSAVEGAIYHKQIQEAEIQNRICNVPYDPMLKVHLILDLGWEDSLACGFVQRNLSEIRVIEYLEAHQTKLDDFFGEIRSRNLNWGRVWLPHDGFSKTLSSNGKSTADIIRSLAWDVVHREEIVEMSVEEGIRHTRMNFHRLYFDAQKTAALKSPETSFIAGFYHTPLSWRLVEVLKRYRRHINKQTDAPGAPVHDQFAHGSDMLRYICLNADKMTNESMTVSVCAGFTPKRAA
jgi:phage terminase large subunit